MKPAIYRTRITHLRRAPVHHYFEHRGYSWYVDLDELPQLPRWLRPFANFDARDHLWPQEGDDTNDTLRQRMDAFLADRGIDLRGGRITALMQARVLGYVFNPITLYCLSQFSRSWIVQQLQTHFGKDVFVLLGETWKPMLERGFVLIVLWLVVYWMYRRKIFVRI